ncbi:MAG: hypothetical protein SGI86_22495 [Deltaproteobacteria bacterium]|nr:hypothetical protein [Deltaproteobacteria bacterium]
MLLVVFSTPPLDEALIRTIGGIVALAPAEVRHKLMGTMPRVLCVDADDARLDNCVRELATIQVHALACDSDVVPNDSERLVAKTLAFTASGLRINENASGVEDCPYSAIELVQRGTRFHDETIVTESTHRKFSMGKALASGGLLMSSKVKTTSVQHKHKSERFILLQRRDGESEIILYERRLDYRFLGVRMDPSAFTNLETVFTELKSKLRGTTIDSTVSQPGFARSFPQTTTDRMDLALYLVALGHRLQRGGV